MIDAINNMYVIKSSDPSFLGKDKQLTINLFDEVKLMTGICPKKKMKRFIDKGLEKMEHSLDLMHLIKTHNRHHKVIIEQLQHHHINDDTLDIDKDSEEKSNNSFDLVNPKNMDSNVSANHQLPDFKKIN